jgi:hypothetical protein
MNKQEIELLQRTFAYDPTTGVITWKVARRGTGICNHQEVQVGDIAGKYYRDYLEVCFNGKTYYNHKLAVVLMIGHRPDQVDHIDQNKLNNAWDNLRPADHYVNIRNMPLRLDNTSGQVGVSRCVDRDAWRVRINIDGKCILIGRYKTYEEAVKMRKEAEIKYGYHVNHGIQSPPQRSDEYNIQAN